MKNIILLLFIVFFYSVSFSQIRLDSGLVAYYPFNGNANDASGNGNNPIENTATLTTDRFGIANEAYFFDGFSSYIRIPNSLSLNTGSQISLCVYVKVNGFYNGVCHGNDIINKGQYQGNSNFYFIRFDDYAYTNGGNCSNSVDTIHQNFYGHFTTVPSPGYTPYITKNQWYCLIYTYDGSTAKLFVDGILKSQAAVSGLNFGNADDLYLGRLFRPSDPTSFPYWFNGVMDDVRIYNRALNQQEIDVICPMSAVPVTITRFETNVSDNQIKLTWNIENEIGLNKYVVERSLTAHSDFIEVGSIKPAHNGQYSYVDNTADVNKNYYYRLAIIESDNSVSYSEIKIAKINTNKTLVFVYPSESEGSILVSIKGYKGKAEFNMINSLGQAVLKKNEFINGNTLLPLKLLKPFKGIYWLRIVTGNEKTIKQVRLY